MMVGYIYFRNIYYDTKLLTLVQHNPYKNMCVLTICSYFSQLHMFMDFIWSIHKIINQKSSIFQDFQFREYVNSLAFKSAVDCGSAEGNIAKPYIFGNYVTRGM